jgi:hypothetical protein
VAGVGLLVAGCVRVAPRPATEPVAPPPEFDTWNKEAEGMLSDALLSLRTFDVFQAFRVGSAAESSIRLTSELAWDPPTAAAWDEATHVTRGLHGRAEQLFLSLTSAQVDSNLWREQRALADATHGLLDLADALTAYRERVDRLPQGDGSGALALLDKAWAQFESSAAAWGLGRAETIGCTSPA